MSSGGKKQDLIDRVMGVNVPPPDSKKEQLRKEGEAERKCWTAPAPATTTPSLSNFESTSIGPTPTAKQKLEAGKVR